MKMTEQAPRNVLAMPLYRMRPTIDLGTTELEQWTDEMFFAGSASNLRH